VTPTDINVNDIVALHLQQRKKVPHSIFAIRLFFPLQLNRYLFYAYILYKIEISLKNIHSRTIEIKNSVYNLYVDIHNHATTIVN
jgi:hypothetical protein